MSEREPATEIDRLLPTPVSNRKTYREENDKQGRRRRLAVAGAAILALTLSVSMHSIIPSTSSIRHHRTKDKDFKATDQLGALQKLTEKSLTRVVAANVAPPLHKSHHESHPNGKIEVIKDKKHKHKHNGNDGGTFRCTSQVMIMRHCDKEVKVTIRGKTQTTDTRDMFGDRHCSAKGKRRSKYIATLFVAPDDYQQLVEDKNGKKITNDGIPPVPMIKSSLGKVSSAAAKKKPQFPSPRKMYALSSQRSRPANNDLSNTKEHENYREIETITPLSNKFHLDVDDRFGPNEEGDLAFNFFESLSKSVRENVDGMMRMASSTTSDSSSSSSVAGSDQPGLCNNGMTVVNWKHSRIPILARALGCGKGQGCPGKYNGRDFDTMWLLTFQYTLLLGEESYGLDVDSSLLALESLAQSLKGSILHHQRKTKHSKGRGSWTITSDLVNEGFDPTN